MRIAIDVIVGSVASFWGGAPANGGTAVYIATNRKNALKHRHTALGSSLAATLPQPQPITSCPDVSSSSACHYLCLLVSIRQYLFGHCLQRKYQPSREHYLTLTNKIAGFANRQKQEQKIFQTCKRTHTLRRAEMKWLQRPAKSRGQ